MNWESKLHNAIIEYIKADLAHKEARKKLYGAYESDPPKTEHFEIYMDGKKYDGYFGGMGSDDFNYRELEILDVDKTK